MCHILTRFVRFYFPLTSFNNSNAFDPTEEKRVEKRRKERKEESENKNFGSGSDLR